ncbi:MAG: amidohydrolase family protein [Ignavibacteriales bacterium]|nr:amidohydrolase family protein [Ignavibacteriales bacterium]
MKQFYLYILTLGCVLFFFQKSNTQTAHVEGIRQNTPRVHALTNVRIVQSPGKVIEKGTIILRDGIIESVGEKISLPADARVWDLNGKTIYAGLIESYSDYGMPKQEQPQRGGGRPQPQQQQEQPRGAKYWNEKISPQTNAMDIFSPDTKSAEGMRKMGFTSALVVPPKGNIKGTSAMVNLGDGKTNELVVKGNVGMHASLDVDFFSDGYPNSLMGVIALIRQSLNDADWYKKANDAYKKYPSLTRPETNDGLASLQDLISQRQTLIVETSDELNELRAKKIADEFKLNLILRGNGYEYRHLDAIKNLKTPIILPVNFPKAPNVETPEDAVNVELSEMMNWDNAPENPKRLNDAGVQFAFTTSTMKEQDKFWENIRKAVDRGLPQEVALASLTTTPAKMFGVESKLGSIEKGKIANLVITDGDLFKEKTKILDVWVDGNRYEITTLPMVDARGTYQTTINKEEFTMWLKGEMDGLNGSLAKGKKTTDSNATKLSSVSLSQKMISLSFSGDSANGMKGVIRMSGTISKDEILGTGEMSDGKTFSWNAIRTSPFVPEADTSKKKKEMQTATYPQQMFPPTVFGREKLPEQPEYIFVNDATIWTQSAQGKIESGDMLIHKGKIEKVGKDLSAPKNAVVIEAKGKHISPGLIDAHSHSAASGSVNEGGQAITAEVRIADVIDCDDISVYRELAGGLTTANILHGSANAIGGQNQVIKLRWGMMPEEMKFEGAIPGIKFALGENPKQSNWGDNFTSRYPQTRMGVEQIIRDEFQAARDYEKSWKEYKEGTTLPPRRDLELEAVLQILNKERIVHCHSYRQDEILAMIRTAEDFGFRIAVFQHILEGYKVADAMAKHGAGGSSFSDWWAYKFEVYDAIPYNGALMHNEGVVVSFNSDSDELARRLNTEASKAMKYGGLKEEEALNFVTLNPAKQMRIDNRVGSLEVGKDADFVVWNESPLSTIAMCEQTWIDGKKFFDRNEDRAMNDTITEMRATLVQKILKEKKGDGGGDGPKKKWRGEYDDIYDHPSKGMDNKN